ncbi:hypothetical protein OOZ15_02305 [Galbibacter sp. EGI 63066]|uniref:hypothetical protein n=1 Tax=Galbibacter sp. EGI 63066 TaxID=2993559 RepID=UPI002248ED50|nr:hypothetical protein [Galbibacter sp. EGI 63066]MCX2678762.1 hypothetical protein [Galbibacter sp. EGI 63066]
MSSMRVFSKLISYLFNPILIPIAGTIIYFFVSPKFNPPETKKLILTAMLIVTVVIPIIFYFLLKNLGWITNSDMNNVKERRIPLYICIILIYITLIKITPASYSTELYFYFVGLLGASIACLIMAYFRFKASLHMTGISALTTFVLGLSFHYEINITFGLAILILAMGAIATARLYLQIHNRTEIVLGIFIGVLSQFITFGYWL